MTSPVDKRPHIADADYYRLGYQLAAQLLNRAAAGYDAYASARPERGVPEVVHDEPLDVARQLLDDAHALRDWYGTRRASWMRWRRPAPQEERLQAFLTTTIEPCCELIAARRLHQLGRAEEAAPLVERVRARARAGKLSYRAYYSLACVEANSGDPEEAIAHLGRALYEAPRARRAELAGWAVDDPAFAGLRAEVLDLVQPAAASAPRARRDAPEPQALADADVAALERTVEELRDRPLEAVVARVRLASAYQLADRTEEAVALDDAVVAALVDLLGADRPATLAAREVARRSHRLLRRSADRPALARSVLELRARLGERIARGA